MSLENKIDELKIALQDTTAALIKAMGTTIVEVKPAKIQGASITNIVIDEVSPPEEFTAEILKELSQKKMAEGFERKAIKKEIENIMPGGSISELDSEQLAKLHAVLVNLKKED
jgi:hypothetical protein